MAKKDTPVANDTKLKAAIKALKAAGLDQFLLGFPNELLISTHMENMPGSATSRIIISLFHQLIEHEVSLNAGNPAYQKALRGLEQEFNALIKNYNVRFDALRGGNTLPGTKTGK